AQVRPPQALECAHHAVAVADVGRVRVALLVGVRVVLAVVGDPADDRALDRHRAGHGQGVGHGLVGGEGAVGEQAVEADGHAEPGDQVHRREDRHVAPVQDVVPGEDRGGDDGQQRHDGRAQVRITLRLGHYSEGRRTIVPTLLVDVRACGEIIVMAVIDLPPSLAEVLEPEVQGVADEIMAAIAAEVPAYARPLEGAFGRGLRAGVDEALRQFLVQIRDPAAGRETEVYRALGRGEWREGRSLDALLAAYRVGARVAWRRLARAGTAAGVAPETMNLLAESIFAYIDELSAESVEGYAQAQALAAGERQRL